MKDKIAYLKNVPLQLWSLVAAIAADIIYILNLILCIHRYTKLDLSNPDEQMEKENGLMEYISAHHAGQAVFIIGLIVLILAVTILFISYIKENETFLKMIMIICLICVDGFVALSLFEEILFKFEIYPDFFAIFMQLFEQAVSIGFVGSLLISFIIFVVNEDYRSNVLILAGSAIWFAFGGIIIVLGIGIMVISILGAIFDGSNDGGNILLEVDKNGNILNRWKKD